MRGQLQALCSESGNGLYCVRGVCGSSNGRACCVRSSRLHASLPEFCIECGSAKPTSRSDLAVRSEGADHSWRKIPPRELSIDLVADERFGRVTGRAGAS